MAKPTIALFLPSLDGGGAERVFVQLANQFVALGFHVDFALASARGPYLDEIATGVRLIDLAASGVLRSLPRLARYVRSECPEVLLSALDHANIVAILAHLIARNGARCVISMRSVPEAVYRKERTFHAWIMPHLMRVAYPFANSIIANSKFVATDLSRFLRVPKSKVSVIYNPLDLDGIEELSRENIEHPWCGPGGAPIILSVGSLALLKDFPTLIRAFSLIRSKRDCRLVILGEGPDRAKLESLIRDLRLQRDVYMPGFANNPFAWMRHAKVFVSSSLTEGCPNALMQALVCRTPVVSTDCVGGSSEVLEGGKWGRLVPVGKPDAMAMAVMATLDSTVHPNVRQRADDFALERIAREYLRVLLPDHSPFAVEH